jgi:hypothetical protein
MASAHPQLVGPGCCRDGGYYWDDLLLYAPHSGWEQSPAPSFWSGPIVRAVPSLDHAMKKIQ